ncbi:MAG: DUF1015 domain-containing protein [Candidatus Omnitrophica bacterium]|nr:DUF1015 domain-containing protein [Candidatus Omnitrophota bacterium]
MPDIRAFKGVLYNPQKINDIAKVITEPYDVINPAQQQAYYELHPYNIINLILGKKTLKDSAKNNQYTRAKEYFAQWQKENVLLRDKKKSIYIYSQSFPYDGKIKTRTGFIALMKLEDFAKNSVLPHENTFSGPVQDRLRLLQTVGANLSPIFALCGDQKGKINKLLSVHKRKHKPYFVFEKEGVVHRLWKMSDRKNIAVIKRLLKDQQIFIADGHHRYEAALNYKKNREKDRKIKCNGCDYNYVMTYLATTTDKGLTILPTHRALKIKSGIKPEEVVSCLKKSLPVRSFSSSAELFAYMRRQPPLKSVFGMYLEGKFYCLLLKNTSRVYRLVDSKKNRFSQSLDVAILHNCIIHKILNISPAQGDIFYTRDAQEAIYFVDQDKYQLAFFLRPTTVREVKKVAKAGERMPHKSTYFYPKLVTGLVVNALD